MAVSADTPVSAGNLKAVVAKLKEWVTSEIANYITGLSGTYLNVIDNVVSGSSGITLSTRSTNHTITFNVSGTFDYEITLGEGNYSGYFTITMPNGQNIASLSWEYGRTFSGRTTASAGQTIYIRGSNSLKVLNCSIVRVA